jgi:hypothetical protein
VLTHLSSFYDATLRHVALHDLEHALYLFSGLLLWWQVVDADPVPSQRLGGLGKLGYMLAAMVPMALVGAYLNRHPTLVYSAHGPLARALGISGQGIALHSTETDHASPRAPPPGALGFPVPGTIAPRAIVHR